MRRLRANEARGHGASDTGVRNSLGGCPQSPAACGKVPHVCRADVRLHPRWRRGTPSKWDEQRLLAAHHVVQLRLVGRHSCSPSGLVPTESAPGRYRARRPPTSISKWPATLNANSQCLKFLFAERLIHPLDPVWRPSDWPRREQLGRRLRLLGPSPQRTVLPIFRSLHQTRAERISLDVTSDHQAKIVIGNGKALEM